ncbi:MAG: hypothetical protein DRO73_09810, partial [Candidatus Thorarchaeota archaeon]
MGEVIVMAIDPIEWCITLLSLTPIVILAVSKLWTDYYRMRIAKGKIELSNQTLPLPVRFYGWSVRSFTTSFVVYIGSIAFTFLFPLLAYAIYWPNMLPEYLDALRYWAPVLFGFTLFIICAISP